MSQSNVEVDMSLEVDLDAPIICEANWVDRENDVSRHCENAADYSAIGHDEINDHKEAQILLCQECVTLLTTHQARCGDCDVTLIRNIVAL